MELDLAPTPYPGCMVCSGYQQALADLIRADPSRAADARVLWTRHLANEHA
ncbi:hypothetical protein G5C65_07355, partial [Streptomyces sp. SB3404]|nr:hypothetical protein [Streptomyces boncukensis]